MARIQAVEENKQQCKEGGGIDNRSAIVIVEK
jgi:hypothetical protein